MQLEEKRVTPPYRPRLECDRDLANFPPEFTDEPVHLTPDDEYVQCHLFYFNYRIMLLSARLLPSQSYWASYVRVGICARVATKIEKLTSRFI